MDLDIEGIEVSADVVWKAESWMAVACFEGCGFGALGSAYGCVVACVESIVKNRISSCDELL